MADVQRLIDALLSSALDEYPAFMEELAAMGAAAIGPIVDAVSDADRVGVRRLAETITRMTDPAVVPHLVQLMGSPHSQLRGHAYAALGRMKDPAAFEPLLAEFERRDSAVLAGAVAGYRDPRAHELLRSKLLAAAGPDPAPEVTRRHVAEASRRQAAALPAIIEGLGMLGDPGGARAGVALFRLDPSPRVLHALVHVVAPGVVEVALEALSHDNAEVRSAGVRLAYYLGVPEVFEPLSETLADRNERVATDAQVRLGDLTGLPFEQCGDPSNVVDWLSNRRGALAPKAVHRLGEPFRLDHLIELLSAEARRTDAVEEFEIVTGLELGYRHDVPAHEQGSVARRARQVADSAGLDLQVGGHYRYGRQQSLEHLCADS